MGSIFRPSLSQESQSQDTMNFLGGGEGASFYNTAFQMLVIASRAGHFTPSCHLPLVIWFSWMIIAHKGKQATEELCWPGIFLYAKILRQTVVSKFNNCHLNMKQNCLQECYTV
jgi:hypothetical protein